jgi:hypothetical protein
MTKEEFERLYDALHWDDYDRLMVMYKVEVIKDTLYIPQAIPVEHFCKIRNELRKRKAIKNVIVEG